MTLRGKVAVITGASSGIGKAIGELFGQQGARIAVVAGRNKDVVDRLSENIRASGGEAVSFQSDISQEDQVKPLFDKIMTVFHRIDILINSAGIIGPATPWSVPPLAFSFTRRPNSEKTMVMTRSECP